MGYRGRAWTWIALGLLALGCKREGAETDVAASPQKAPCLEGGDWKQHICGPFSIDAIKTCQDLGGKEACLTQRWSRDFHRKVVAAMKNGETNCLNGEGDLTSHRCGPFDNALVEACFAAKGGGACVGNRWSKSFFDMVTKKAPAASGGGDGATQQQVASGTKRVLVGVPFLSQPTNNTCGPTSMTMALRYMKVPADIWDINSRVPASVQEPMGNAAEFRRHGLYSQGTANGTKAMIMKMIDQGRPVVLHTYLTSSGHVVLVIGYDKEKKGFYIHDPWGKYLGYRDGYGGDADSGRDSFVSWNDPNLMTSDGDIWISAGDTKPFSF